MIYIFYGADTFSRREAFEELRRSLDEDGSLETNTLRLSARETTPDEVISACAAAPFLGGRRLVVLEGLLRIAEEGGGRGRKPSTAGEHAASAWQPLLDFVEQMPESTTLVLLDGAAAEKNPLLAALKPHAEVREFRPPDPRQLAAWVQERAKKLGLKIEVKAARLLAQMVGGQDDKGGREYLDTWALASELDKLAAFANGEVIGEKDVQALSPVLRDQKGYFLCDAIVERRPAAAAKLLHELMAQGEPGQLLLSTVAGRFRRLAIAREMLDRGETGAAIGRELGSSGYALERVIEQAGRYSLDDIRAAYARIVAADFSNKSGLSDEAVELETMVQELTSS